MSIHLRISQHGIGSVDIDFGGEVCMMRRISLTLAGAKNDSVAVDDDGGGSKVGIAHGFTFLVIVCRILSTLERKKMLNSSARARRLGLYGRTETGAR